MELNNLKMELELVHWIYILQFGMLITFLFLIVPVGFFWKVRKDWKAYQSIDIEALGEMKKEVRGWIHIRGDVFRPPSNPSMLCAMVGNGSQILGMAVVTTLLIALGFISPASPRTLIVAMLFFYMMFGIGAGYVAVRMWRTMVNDSGGHRGWIYVSLKSACFYPGIAFMILYILEYSHSSTGIPFYLLVTLILLWLFISLPLTLVGGFYGTKATHIRYPVQTNQLARGIPQESSDWFIVVAFGTISIGPFWMGLVITKTSIWIGGYYYFFGLFFVIILLVLVCAEVSLVLTYILLGMENYKWWWKSFFTSGFISFIIFLYCVKDAFDVDSSDGPVSTLYLGYSLIIVIAIMLGTGTVGFLSSFWFVHFLFSLRLE